MPNPVQPQDRQSWWDKNLQMNQDVDLAIGMFVRDADGLNGQVIGISRGLDIEDHGMITIRTHTGYEEHYSHWGWQKWLRITEN